MEYRIVGNDIGEETQHKTEMIRKWEQIAKTNFWHCIQEKEIIIIKLEYILTF